MSASSALASAAMALSLSVASFSAALAASILALKDVSDKVQAAAVDASAELKDVLSAGFKSLLAGWEEAKKTFGENRK